MPQPRRSPVAILSRPGALLTPMGLGAPAPGFDDVAHFALVTSPERFVEHLARGQDACESSDEQRRRALVAMAELEVIPAIAASEGLRPAPPENGSYLQLEDLAVPVTRGSLSGSRGVLRDFLRRLGAPRGFLVEADGVRRISMRRTARRQIAFDGVVLPLTLTRQSLVRHRRQLEAALAHSVNVSQAIADLAEKLPAARDPHAQVLHAGPEFSVTLEEKDMVRVARRLDPWEVCHEETRRYFPAAEIRVHVGLDLRARPWVSVVSVTPALRHMFTRSGRVCIDGYTGRAPNIGRRVLELLERAESVLKVPTNPDGAGGYQSLESSGSRLPRVRKETTR